MTCTGWKWHEAELELDFDVYGALIDYWIECPPVHVSVSSVVGYRVDKSRRLNKPPESRPDPTDDDEAFGQFLNMMMGGQIG